MQHVIPAWQDTVAAFYAAISSPGNLTEALELLAPEFVYQVVCGCSSSSSSSCCCW